MVTLEKTVYLGEAVRRGFDCKWEQKDMLNLKTWLKRTPYTKRSLRDYHIFGDKTQVMSVEAQVRNVNSVLLHSLKIFA